MILYKNAASHTTNAIQTSSQIIWTAKFRPILIVLSISKCTLKHRNGLLVNGGLINLKMMVRVLGNMNFRVRQEHRVMHTLSKANSKIFQIKARLDLANMIHKLILLDLQNHNTQLTKSVMDYETTIRQGQDIIIKNKVSVVKVFIIVSKVRVTKKELINIRVLANIHQKEQTQ